MIAAAFLSLALVAPFVTGLQYTVDGAHPHTVVIEGDPHGAPVAWLLPEPEPTAPLEVWAESQAPLWAVTRAPAVLDPLCGVPEAFQPDHATTLVFPVAVDVRHWAVPRTAPDPGKWPVDARGAWFAWFADGVTGLNQVFVEAGFQIQIVHINMHDTQDPLGTWDAAAWWLAADRIHRFARDGKVWLIDFGESDTGWWSDGIACGGFQQTGAWGFTRPERSALSNGPNDEDWTHEHLHNFGVPHPADCDPPREWCDPPRLPLICPAEEDLVATSYCGFVGCSVYEWERQQFTPFFVRLARYRQEGAAPCALRIHEPWPPARVATCAPALPGDGMALALLLPMIGMALGRARSSLFGAAVRRWRAGVVLFGCGCRASLQGDPIYWCKRHERTRGQ